MPDDVLVGVTLATCEDEQIQIPGSIQPHGVLLALRSRDLVIEQTAGDTLALLGHGAQTLRGHSLATLLDPEQIDRLLGSRQPDGQMERFITVVQSVVTRDGRTLSASAHDSAGVLVIEFEPMDTATGDRVIALLQIMQHELQSTGTTIELSQRVARSVRTATGFDRVMLYQFQRDGSGIVQADAHAPDMEPFLGLHYPASDIPSQARALYLKQWLRLIPDVRYRPAPLLPRINPTTAAPLDLGRSALRSVSPIHLEYLANMGVAATLTISIVVAGKLWGLIACHHRTPRTVPPDLRAVCELFAETVSLRLAANVLENAVAASAASRRTLDALLLATGRQADFAYGLTRMIPSLLDLVAASGATVWLDRKATSVGEVPGQDGIARLCEWLDTRDDTVFATDHLALDYPQAFVLAPTASGLLCFRLSVLPTAYVIWYLPEQVRNVTWAGDPAKSVTSTANGGRLSPRGSFSAWTQEVRGQSRPWQESEIEAASMLRIALHNVVLRQVAAAEREKATRQQEMLMAELDHRVKNMLATIQSLARQSKAGETTLNGFLRSFEGRLRAMSRAHNVLTASRWIGVDLATMINEELEPYGGVSARQVLVNAGSKVLLRPKAALAMCLAIHELATNAGKYGALSTPGGRVEVDWNGQQRSGDMLLVTWHEHGGPPVHKPTRTGFGTKLITTSLSYEIDGDIDLSFPAEGVICRISIPWEQIVESGPAAANPARPPQRAGNELRNARVLIVEDNAMLAMEMVEAMEEAGAVVVGPAPRLPAALRYAETADIDVAVLDIDLDGTKVWPAAEALARRGIPFCFASGFDGSLVMPAGFRDRQLLNKPYVLADLEAVLVRLLGAPQG